MSKLSKGQSGLYTYFDNTRAKEGAKMTKSHQNDCQNLGKDRT